jgi:primosomal protein N' (replication factor Y)
VTGSGKTHVYLEAAAEAIAAGRQAIVLVAEIALTPAALERFEARFPGRVVALHSRLGARQRRQAWERIASGAAQLIVGARSALFAPAPRPGLIVLDEAHEWAYKQEQSPRYDARAVAVRLGELTGAPVLLSSATPDVESFYRAQTGAYTLLRLTERYTPRRAAAPIGAARGARDAPTAPLGQRGAAGDGRSAGALPAVTIVDLRAELRAGNRSLFSRALDEAVRAALGRGEQVILYLNRRGGATCVTCRDCGHTLRCRRCDLPLVYHSASEALVCHVCNRRQPSPARCPQCASARIRYLGLGTQRVELEAQQRYPGARVLRWDRDVASSVELNAWLWRTFAVGQADILVGTQMIAKALDFPNVTVVGVMLADSGLFLPDFRAAERSFQLLSQVAGRAGRGGRPGQAFIQTYSPEHYAVQAAAAHDYAGFYARELAFRREHGYPPFRRLARVVHTGSSETRGWAETLAVAERLEREIRARGLADVELLGAAPAFYHRVRGAYRWQIVLAGDRFERLLDVVPQRGGWSVDVDPLSLL